MRTNPVQKKIDINSRAYVTKSNEVRFIRRSGNKKKFKDFNKELVINEYFGSKLYELGCSVSRCHIGTDLEGNYTFNSAQLASAITLQEYLGIDLMKPLDQYSAEERRLIAEKLNRLKGIGPILFMGMLLGDSDVFGIGLANVLVTFGEDGQPIAWKIDTSDIKMPTPKLKKEESPFMQSMDSNQEAHAQYTDLLPLMIQGMINKTFPFPHATEKGGSPFLDFFYNMLNDENTREAIGILKGMFNQKEEVGNYLLWMIKAVNLDESLAKEMQVTLESRLKSMIPLLDPKKKKDPITIEFKPKYQKYVMLSSDSFIDTNVRLEGGNSKPKITFKYSRQLERTNRNLLLHDIFCRVELLLSFLHKSSATYDETLKEIIREGEALKSLIDNMPAPSDEYLKQAYQKLIDIINLIENSDLSLNHSMSLLNIKDILHQIADYYTQPLFPKDEALKLCKETCTRTGDFFKSKQRYASKAERPQSVSPMERKAASVSTKEVEHPKQCKETMRTGDFFKKKQRHASHAKAERPAGVSPVKRKLRSSSMDKVEEKSPNKKSKR